MAAQSDGGFLEAAEHIRRGVLADSSGAQGTDEAIRCQARHFLGWASKTSGLIPPERLRALRLVSNTTSEHRVYFDAVQNRAVKVTLAGEFGWIPSFDNGRWNLGVATPLDYLRRWHLFNEVFGDDVRLEGVTCSQILVATAGNEIERVSAVISQSWRKAGKLSSLLPDDGEICAFLNRLGFDPLPGSFGGWRRAGDGVVLLDAFPDNFIKTEFCVMPIDLPITRVDTGIDTGVGG